MICYSLFYHTYLSNAVHFFVQLYLGSSDLLSPIFNREKKQEEVRKPMSLSERLRQEFGLDDSTDTDDPERKNGNMPSL